jgi:hypothetical protein
MPAREARFGTRSSNGMAMQWQNGNAYTAPGEPTWFRLTRLGDTFTAYQSIDGKNRFAVGSPVTVQMNNDLFVGFAVASNSDKADNCHFDNATVERTLH